MKTKSLPLTTAQKIVARQRLLDRAKKLYHRADVALDAMLDELTVGQVVELPDGGTATLVDNFAKGNVAFGHGAVRRFDLKIKD